MNIYGIYQYPSASKPISTTELYQLQDNKWSFLSRCTKRSYKDAVEYFKEYKGANGLFYILPYNTEQLVFFSFRDEHINEENLLV